MACRLVGASHYLNQCWNTVNWTLRYKLHWRFYFSKSKYWRIWIGKCSLANFGLHISLGIFNCVWPSWQTHYLVEDAMCYLWTYAHLLPSGMWRMVQLRTWSLSKYPTTMYLHISSKLMFFVNFYRSAFIMMTPSNGHIFRVTGPLCGELMFSLIYGWTNGWGNNLDAGD